MVEARPLRNTQGVVYLEGVGGVEADFAVWVVGVAGEDDVVFLRGVLFEGGGKDARFGVAVVACGI